jgi:glycosyltransferase involved in cell wall biosynthesis
LAKGAVNVVRIEYGSLLSDLVLRQSRITFDGSRHGFDVAPELTEMRAAGVLVLAYRFGCISECVIDDATGYMFNDQKGIADLLKRLACTEINQLEHLRANCADLLEAELLSISVCES